MDLDFASTSFNDFFDNNTKRSWIITKKEKGKVKLARCPEDELDEYDTTRADLSVRTMEEDEAQESSSDRKWSWQLHGTAMFLIADLLNCPKETYYFECKNIPFVNVLLCGTITSVSIYQENYSIVVGDGTSEIRCLIKKNELTALQLSEEQKLRHIELAKAIRANPNDPVLKAKGITMRLLKNLVKNIPSLENLKSGDIVTIIGNLTEHNSKRYIFIKSIEKEDSLFHITYLEQLYDLYENKYVSS